jgi:putative tryptophan/tyrosine transport system substrate-binding protein
MDRRRFLLTSLAGAFAAPLAAEAQPAGRLPRIGILATAPSAYSQVFRQALIERGYVENRTVEIDARYSEGKPERFPELAAALVDRRVDVLFAVSEVATRAARQATTTIPIVMLVADDPVEAGLVSSLTRPRGNVTGFSSFQPDLVAKRLQLLKELLPGLSRVAVLGHAPDPMVGRSFNEAGKHSAALQVTVRAYQVSEPTELDDAFMRMAADRPQGVLILQNFWMFRHREKVTALAARTGLPTLYGLRDYVLTGGLMAYAPDYREHFVRAATYVDRILKGAKPSDLPVERSTRFELVINLKTAKALGLTIPPSLLTRADQVIE